MRTIRVFLMSAGVIAGLAMGQATPGQKGESAMNAKAGPNHAPTPEEIASAKAKGLVWVNPHSRLFYKPLHESYGKTGTGEFMTEEEALKGKNKLAKPVQRAIGKRPPKQTKLDEGKR